jgi:hypothetical protein
MDGHHPVVEQRCDASVRRDQVRKVLADVSGHGRVIGLDGRLLA